MYTHGVQNNNQDQAFYNLNRQFAGRGLAKQARDRADSYGREAMYGTRGRNSSPLTLEEFAANYRKRNFYSPVTSTNTKAVPQNRPCGEVQSRVNAATAQKADRLSEQPKTVRSARMENNGVRKNQPVRATGEKKKAAVVELPKKRRAVKNQAVVESAAETFNSIALSFRRIPAAMLFMIALCAVSLTLIVSSSVLVSDASANYNEVKSNVVAKAKEESELLIALEVKNDLRVVEDIAVNKLGMVKKDLVSRQYISLSDEDIIETYEDDERNVGLSTLLSAIVKGN